MAVEIKVGRTVYTAERLMVRDAQRGYGVRASYSLTGPRGATYLVTDYGPKFRPNSIALGGGRSWRAQPRPLAGLTNEHLADLFGRTVEPVAETQVAN